MGGKALTCRSEEEQSSRNQPVESHVEPFRPRLYFKGENLKTIPSHLNIYSKLPEWSPTSSESKRPTNSAKVSLCGVEVRLCYCFRPLRPGDNRLATSGNGILSGGHDVQVEKQVGPAGQRNYTDVIVTTP